MIIGCIQSCNDVYTMLTEIKTDDQHYFVDDHHRIQGEYKRYHVNGQLRVHSFFQNGNYHGEYKSYQKMAVRMYTPSSKTEFSMENISIITAMENNGNTPSTTKEQTSM